MTYTQKKGRIEVKDLKDLLKRVEDLPLGINYTTTGYF